MKKIFFNLLDNGADDWAERPNPAAFNIPDWYREMSPYYMDKSIKIENNVSNMTSKKCVPMFDAMIAGYNIKLDFDIIIENGTINWASDASKIMTHVPHQSETIPIPEEYINMVYKWKNLYLVQTPPGYSTLFLSPMLRFDLPFYSFPGIVDTDSWNIPTNFPFLLKKDFCGVLTRGTPIIQAIPFRREDWKMEVGHHSTKQFETNYKKFRSSVVNYYRNKFWNRKKYS